METDAQRLKRIYREKRSKDLSKEINKISVIKRTPSQQRSHDYYVKNKEKIIERQKEKYKLDLNYNKNYYIKNKTRQKNYYEENKEAIKLQRQARYPLIRDKLLEKNKIWRESNPEKVKQITLRKKEKYEAKKLEENLKFLELNK